MTLRLMAVNTWKFASEAKWNQINIAGYGEYGTNKIIYKATKHFNASPADINRYSIG